MDQCRKTRNYLHTLRRKVPFHFTIPRCAQLSIFYGQNERHRKVGNFQLRKFKFLVFKRGHFTIRSRGVGNHSVSASGRSVNCKLLPSTHGRRNLDMDALPRRPPKPEMSPSDGLHVITKLNGLAIFGKIFNHTSSIKVL